MGELETSETKTSALIAFDGLGSRCSATWSRNHNLTLLHPRAQSKAEQIVLHLALVLREALVLEHGVAVDRPTVNIKLFRLV